VSLIENISALAGPWKLAIALLAGIVFVAIADRKARR
jgi:hypothetical protein